MQGRNAIDADVIDEAREQIIANLKVLNISEASVWRIMAIVDNMSEKSHIMGALKFLTQITEQKSRREDYYQYSNILAEYFCTISNLGLFAVGFYYRDFTTLAAATFSALSHAFPLQRLHDLDLLGVFLVFGKAMANYKLLMERPDILAFGAGAMTINMLDTVITRKYLDKIGPSLHVTWHLAAALAIFKLNQGQAALKADELQTLASAAAVNHVPGYLYAAFETITEYMAGFASGSHCTIA